MEERLQLAVFIDFDNIEIGVKTTLNTELDLALILDALRERGEVVAKSAYGDWARAGQHSRTLTEHAVHMVQRNVTPRGDKNGADINLVVDALEMAFTRPHINGFAIVGGDSDFIALVEKLKQFGKRVFVVGGRGFTSGILQRNCHEFIAYENLLGGSRGGRGQATRGSAGARLPLAQAWPLVQRALKILSDRGVEPQLGPLKSTLLQLDPTFSERSYGASSFREFVQRLAARDYLSLRRIDQGYVVETNGDGAAGAEAEAPAPSAAPRRASRRRSEEASPPVHEAGGDEGGPASAVKPQEQAVELLRRATESIGGSRAGKPTYVRHLAQALRAIDPEFDEESYGFRTLTELMRLGAREGLFKMQRDRQGAWRVTIETAERESDVSLPSGAEGEREERAAAEPPETDRAAGASPGGEAGSEEPERELAGAGGAAAAEKGPEAAEPARESGSAKADEPPAEKPAAAPRKRTAARSTSKSGTKKASSRSRKSASAKRKTSSSRKAAGALEASED